MKHSAFLLAFLLIAASPVSGQAPSPPAGAEASSELEQVQRQAAKGDAEAQWRLCVMLDVGEGVASNPAEAVQWFRRAMASGSAKAHASMGMMYATGRGVPVDYVASMKSYRDAARLGEPHGFFGVGILHARGEGVTADVDEAFGWMMVAAARGDPQATDLINRGAFKNADATRATSRAGEIAKEFGLRIEPGK